MKNAENYIYVIGEYLQGSAPESAVDLKAYQNLNIEATLMCTTAIEREFFRLFGDIFKNCEK